MSNHASSYITLTFGVDHFLVTATPNALVFNKVDTTHMLDGSLNTTNLSHVALESIVVPFSTHEEISTFKAQL